MLTTIILATVAISLVSLVGILTIYGRGGRLDTAKLRPVISLAAGTLLGAAFLDLLPEAIEGSGFDPHVITATVLGSMLFFFLLERVFHWHHCRCGADGHDHGRPDGHRRSLAVTNLIGEALHNLIDGVLVAAAFSLNFGAGVAATVAVILHEVPQEISDFGVLLYAGLRRSRALLLNLLVALTAIVGAVAFYLYGEAVEMAVPIVAAVAAGNFIYMATADLLPELGHERRASQVAGQVVLMLLGVGLIWALGGLLPHSHG